MALKVILADNQVIFRTGAVKVLAMDAAVHVVAQCSDVDGLMEALRSVRDAVVLFPSSLSGDLNQLIDCIRKADGKPVVILEHDAELEAATMERVEGVVLRSVTSAQLMECLHSVGAGVRFIQRADLKPGTSPDDVGANLLRRLTPRELQIIALVTEGCKNREIAVQLGTKEQVIKNYLCGIYDKTGVSDRLELALYTVHHRTLAAAAERVRATLVRVP